MPIQDVALICLNGHMINQSSIKNPENNTQYCETCGQRNISKCIECGSFIRGEIHYDGVFDWDEIKPPSYCHECGKPYPWTTERIKALIEMVEYSKLNAADKKEFVDNIEIIASDNPRTSLAAIKIKSIGKKLAGGLWNDVAKPLIVEIASETAKKSMGL
ncbi:DUF2321 domain-containing protein [Desulfosporosinus metallidurans]|nr:DUF2321 domain-containing protein [Desulfosporosinus metallidurans]